MTAPSGAAPAPPERPFVLARRTLRVLTWVWLAALVLFAASYVAQGDLFFLTAASLMVLASALLVSLPGIFFVIHTLVHRGAPLSPALRRSAAGSGIASLIAAWLLWRMSGGFALAGPLAVAGLLVVIRAASVGRGAAGAGSPTLRHVWTTVWALIAILGAMRVLTLATGTKDTAYLAAMKADLHDLMTAEEAFRADSGRFGERAQLLWAPASGDSVALTLSADRKGWRATATRASSISQCGIWIGERPPDGMHGAKEGTPRCW